VRCGRERVAKKFLSVAPGFSRVMAARAKALAASAAFGAAFQKPLKRFCSISFSATRLKPGANERRAASILAFAAVVMIGISLVRAEAPPLDGFFPAGAARGSTNSVTAIGKFDAWPPKVWVSERGLMFTAETNKGKFSVIVAGDAAPGARLVRLFNEDGASEPRMFVIGAGREMLEAEPNNHFAKPQLLENFPSTINGRLDKNGDVDSFAIDLRASQWLEARVDGYTLMSKVDAVLRLVATNGQQLSWNHDFATLDPRLTWCATNDGTVVLQLFGFAYPPGSEVGLTGGEATAYRLHLSITNTEPRHCASPMETEPNDRAEAAEISGLPASVSGVIANGADEDRFRISAQVNDFVEARLEAASFGSPLDAWLKIEDSAGNQIARSDDSDGSPDPRLEWKATNTAFVVAVGSVTHRGGADFCYRLNVRKLGPDFSATVAASSIVLTPGATNEWKLDVKRFRGFTNTLTATVRGLPAGVTLLTTNVAEKDPALKLAAADDAPKFQGPVQIVLRDAPSGRERIATFELTSRGETGYARLLVEATDDLWLTMRAKPKETKKADGK